MKSLLTTIFLGGVIFLASCSNKDNASSNVLVIPSADSVSKNSDFKINLSASDSVEVHDLTVQGLPVETLIASNTYNPLDSTYSTNIVIADSKKKVISINLTAISTPYDPLAPLSIYTVMSNSSTFTDYRSGENKTYSIATGSTLTLTSATYPVTGTFSLTLNYNTNLTYVTGHFSIYR